jgi:hypothetical protein
LFHLFSHLMQHSLRKVKFCGGLPTLSIVIIGIIHYKR